MGVPLLKHLLDQLKQLFSTINVVPLVNFLVVEVILELTEEDSHVWRDITHLGEPGGGRVC